MEIKVGCNYTDEELYWDVTVLRVDDNHVYCARLEDGMPLQYTVKAFLEICHIAKGDVVHSPKHYQVFPDKEAIEIIASSMTFEQFYGYCLGNFLKYRLRIGAKDEVQQELEKSNKYKELYEKHKHLCK